MSPPLRLALGLSVALHAVALVGLPATEPVAFDVERAPTSVELYLIAETPAATRPAHVEEPTSPPVEATAATVQERRPEPQTVVSREQRGAQLDQLPGYLRNPPPVYPRAAREQGDEGTALLEVEVLPSGRCGTLRVVRSSGYDVLDQAAVEAVRQWVFKPARRWREPVAFQVEIPITFRLVDGDPSTRTTASPARLWREPGRAGHGSSLGMSPRPSAHGLPGLPSASARAGGILAEGSRAPARERNEQQVPPRHGGVELHERVTTTRRP